MIEDGVSHGGWMIELKVANDISMDCGAPVGRPLGMKTAVKNVRESYGDKNG